MYVVSMPGQDEATMATSALAADLICGDGALRHKDTLLAQLRTLNTGDTAYLSGGIVVRVIGYGDEEEPAPPPEPLPDTMGY